MTGAEAAMAMNDITQEEYLESVKRKEERKEKGARGGEKRKRTN